MRFLAVMPGIIFLYHYQQKSILSSRLNGSLPLHRPTQAIKTLIGEMRIFL